MIIQEINENNYAEEIQKGQEEIQKKFELVKSFGDISNTNPETEKKWGFIMRDPTCWAYAYFKDPEGNPLKFYPFQDALVNDKNRLVLGVAANQIGKTLALCIKALHHACYVKNAFVLIVSRSEEQAVRILDIIKGFMRFGRADFDSMKDEVDNRMELHLKSKHNDGISVIKCVPPTTSALGYPATLEILDELGFWEIKSFDSDTKYFYQVLETRTNTTQNWKHPFLTIGQIIGISNPNGQQGLLYGLWKNDKRFNCYKFCWLAKPTNTFEKWLEYKKNLPSDVFDSSYAAVFSSATGGFITRYEFENACKTEIPFKIDPGEPFFLGGDLAGEDTHSRDVDLSVLYGVQKNMDTNEIKVVYYREFSERTPKSEIYDEIERLNDLYSIQLFAYDKVAVGDSVLNDLVSDRKILSIEQIEPLTYSLPNKSEVYYNMKHLFEQGNVKIPSFDGRDKLKEELMNLKFVKTPGGHIKVHGAGKVTITGNKAKFQEEKHDDHADSFANACYAARLESSMPSAKWV